MTFLSGFIFGVGFMFVASLFVIAWFVMRSDLLDDSDVRD